MDASDGKTYQTINPTDEAAICELAASGAQDVEKAIKAAKVRSRSYMYMYVYILCSKGVKGYIPQYMKLQRRCKNCSYVNCINPTALHVHCTIISGCL